MAKKQAKTEARNPVIGLQITPDDRDVLERLQAKMQVQMGKMSVSMLLRLAIRRMAKEEGV